ncbi:hypothetical protein [Paenibacillus faecalis]|uniref:hypothetical protein n=1 Tax=Paenibacillus faecalis TaxID=2079532 RepID=UPI000D0EEBEA|nr:hypothetical protein [Paenibacillus faecalis]
MRRGKKIRNFRSKKRLLRSRKLIRRGRRGPGKRLSIATPAQQAINYNQAYDKGFDEAYNEGFNVGYSEGMEAGHQEAYKGEG